MGILDGLLGRKSPPMLGLDISSTSVKLVELSQNKSGEFVLERFASESFEKGWIAEPESQIPAEDLTRDSVAWFVTTLGNERDNAKLAEVLGLKGHFDFNYNNHLMGGAAFNEVPNVTHTVGLGARVLLPQFNTEVIRIDLGFVVNGPGDFGIDRFSSSFGQVTDNRPTFLDQPL